MKRFFRSDASMIIFAVLLITLSAWVSVSLSNTKGYAARDREAKEDAIYQRGYDAGYEDASEIEWLDGYEFGYDEGYYEAISETPEAVQGCIEESFYELESDIRRAYEMSVEDAFQIIVNHAEGEPISDDEINKAIWIAEKYYWDSQEIINNVENYQIQ